MKTVGVDGCKKGWFAVALSPRDGWKIEIFNTVSDLWEAFQGSSLILIDMPIGLSGTGKRSCDVAARKILKYRPSSVFPPPCREALQAKTYYKACQINKRIFGTRLSIQTWNISGKMQEVDEWLRHNKQAQGRVREAHPEVCFWALAGGRPMIHSKKTPQGFAERQATLEKIYPLTGDIVKTALGKYLRRDLAKDDILDAIALALTAAYPPGSIKTIPQKPPKDAKGLPMEIVFPFIRPNTPAKYRTD